ELFEQAAALEADLVLAHHGLFWGEPAGPITPQLKRRLKLLFDHDLALAAYHLPLDAHPELGNNALIAAALGATATEPFAVHRGRPTGPAPLPPPPPPRHPPAPRAPPPAGAGPLVLPRRPRSDPHPRDRQRLGTRRSARGGRPGPGRVPDRRTRRARHGQC